MSDDESPLAGTEVHYLRSARAGEELKVFVGHCGDLGAPAGSAPTLYLTDANGLFGMAVDIIRMMQLATHLPPMLVIGVGYRAGALAETVPARARDYTPTHDPAYVELYPEQSALGGAGAFLDALRHELIPWVEERYAPHPGDRTYFGHSLGGLFGAFALLQSPPVFRRFVISSPSLWWHGQVLRSLEEDYAATHDDLPAQAFFGIGADETLDGRQREAVNETERVRRLVTLWGIDMVADMHALVERLDGRRYPGLALDAQVFDTEFHVTVPSLVLSRGLRWLFDAPR